MTRNLYTIPNPDGSDPAAYINIKIERAPDNAGAPGIFAQIAQISIDTASEDTDYLDAGGTLTSWYKHRYATLADAIISDYSPAMQLGDYIVRQWCMADLPSTTVLSADWDRWRDQVFQEMASNGLGTDVYPPQEITPTSQKDEWHDINSAIRRVTMVEKYDSQGYLFGPTINWFQYGRKLRIINPMSTTTYKLYGVGEIRGLNDLDDEMFGVLKYGMRVQYLLFRQHERVDFRPYLGRTRTADTPHIPDFKVLVQQAQLAYDQATQSAQRGRAMQSGGGRA